MLITITLLAFLVVLVVSLATLTRVETQVSTNSQQLAQARQNALFALNVALGQLQHAAGPDQRVTATADTLNTTDPTKKKWTGVWDTRPANWATAPVWLVSQADPAVAPVNTGAVPTLAAGVASSTTAVRLVGSNTTDITTPGNEVVVPLQPITSSTVPGFAAGTTIGRYGYWVGDEGVKARINLPDPYVNGSTTIPLPLPLLYRTGAAQRTAWELFSGPTSPTPATPTPSTVISPTVTDQSSRLFSGAQLNFLAPSATAEGTAVQQMAKSRYHDYSLWSAGVQADVRNGGLKWDLSSAFDLTNASFQLTEFGDKAPVVVDSFINKTISPINSYSTPTKSGPQVSFVFLPRVDYTYNGTTKNLYLRGPTWHLMRDQYLLYKPQNPTASAASALAQIIARGMYPGGANTGSQSPGGTLNIPNWYEMYWSPDPNTTLDNTKIDPKGLQPRATQASIVPYINRILLRFGVKTVRRPLAARADVPAPAPPVPTDVYAVQLVLSPTVVLHNPYDVPVIFKDYTPSNKSPNNLTAAAQISLFSAGSGDGFGLTTRVFTGGNDYMVKADSSINDGAGGVLLGLMGNRFGAVSIFRLLLPDGLKLAPGEFKVLYPVTPSGNDVTVTSAGDTYVRMDSVGAANSGANTAFIFPCLNGQRNDPFIPAKPADPVAGTPATPETIPTQMGPIHSFDPIKNPSNPEFNAPFDTVGSDTVPCTTWITSAEFDGTDADPTHAKSVAYNRRLGKAYSEIWCNGSDNVQVVFNTLSQYCEIKYGVESASPGLTTSPDLATANDAGSASMAYQLSAYMPKYKVTTGPDYYLPDYVNFYKPGTTTRADDYKRPTSGSYIASSLTTTRYLFAMDFYVKAADHDSTRASRPFITSNPVAPVNFKLALGDQTALNTIPKGTSGFPALMPSYQMDLIDIDAQPNLYDNMVIDKVSSSATYGDTVWGPHGGRDSQLFSTLDPSKPGLWQIPLIHIPSRPLTSLGEFQHANLSLYGYQPYFAVGNSYASPSIPPDAAVNPVGYMPGGTSNGDLNTPYFLYDFSYWMNDGLWDKYFLSSLAEEFNSTTKTWNSNLTDNSALMASIGTWASGSRTLANSRIVPYSSSRITAANNLTNAQTAYRQVAASSLTLGSFNINSRSVDAWAAVLGAARGASVVANGSGTPAPTPIPGGIAVGAATAIPRMTPLATQSDSSTLSSATWTGFTALTDDKIRQLARNIVDEITRRQNGTTYNHVGVAAPARSAGYTGPFRSLADFINRNLTRDLSGNKTGASGAIQSALDEPTNSKSPNQKFFTGGTYQDVSTAQGNTNWAFKWNATTGTSDYLAGQGPTTSTALGFILQADVLQQIGPFLSARSDTFTIRTYGESVNPATGATVGKAWCEAVVQRLPEYVDQSDPALSTAPADGLQVPLYDATPPSRVDSTTGATVTVNAANTTFGRRFKIVSFRWLGPQDI